MSSRIRVILSTLFTLFLFITTVLVSAYTALLFMHEFTCVVMGCELCDSPVALMILFIASILLFTILMARTS